MTNERFLLELCKYGFQRRSHYFTDTKGIYSQRMMSEYQLITSLGYTDYILIIWDIVEWARENDILVGPARGSVAGSLVAFLTGITDIDPIKYDLMFERFMNPVRSKFDPPDVDLDFQSTKRDMVKQYVFERYGLESVCNIGSHSRAYASGAIKDVAKIMGLDFQELNSAIANKLYDMTLTQAYDAVSSFQEWVEYDEQHEECYILACKLEGLARHKTVHPSGLVVTRGAVTDFLPLHRVGEIVCTQWKDTYVGKRGILKLDILGLDTLDMFARTYESLGKKIDFLDIPIDDEEVFKMFSRGDTAGIFQFETPHLANITKRLGIDKFDDLVIATTIARPGSKDIGVTDSIIRRKNGQEKVSYPHKSVEELLSTTYGYPIYQELVMKLAHIAGNIPLVDTEIMRDAIKHFRHEVMASFETAFKKGAKENHATDNQANKMWEMIQSASGYTYNKAHATAYSLISYICGYLKCYYPLEFMTACMSMRSSEKIPELVSECQRLGIDVKPVNINKSKETFSEDGFGILCGLTSIKSVGVKAAQAIIEARPYKDFDDFVAKVNRRACNKRVHEALKKAGVFEDKPSPKDMLDGYGFILFGRCKTDTSMNIDELDECEMCSLKDCRYKVVKGDGNEDAEIMFVGEAPGHNEDMSGKPFVGRAGQLLRGIWLPALELKPSDVWITNSVKCAPKDDNGKIGKPNDEHLAICSSWLDKEIDTINPRIIVALGSYALQVLTNARTGIMKMHGNVFEINTKMGGKRPHIVGFALYHPAYVLYRHDATISKEITRDLNDLKEYITFKKEEDL